MLDLKYKKEKQNEMLMSAIQSISVEKVTLEKLDCCITSINGETLQTALTQNFLDNLEFLLLSDETQRETEKVVSLLHSLDFKYKGYINLIFLSVCFPITHFSWMENRSVTIIQCNNFRKRVRHGLTQTYLTRCRVW